MNKRIIIKLEKKILKPLINKEFKEKIKKIKGLHKEIKKIANQIEYEKEEKLELDSELNKLTDLDGESVMKTQIIIVVLWLDQQIYYQHKKLINRVSRLIVDLGIHNKILLLVGIGNFRETQTVCQGIFLEKYISTKSYFTKGGIYIMPDGMVVPEQLK